jgi:hypothetical protein
MLFETLATANQPLTFDGQFVLNDRVNNEANGGTPFTFTVSSDNNQPPQVITSPIIPQNIKSNLSGVKPPRHPGGLNERPNAQHNAQVRKYIYEAFEDYFGADVANKCLPNFLTEANKGKPVLITKYLAVGAVPAGLEEAFNLQDAFEKLAELYDDESNAKANVIKNQAKNLEHSATIPIPPPHSELNNREALALYSRATDPEVYRQELLKALYYSAETITRSAGVVAGAAGGAVVGAASGAFSGAITGVFGAAGGVGATLRTTTSAVVGAVVGAASGAAIASNINDDFSFILTASNFGAVISAVFGAAAGAGAAGGAVATILDATLRATTGACVGGISGAAIDSNINDDFSFIGTTSIFGAVAGSLGGVAGALGGASGLTIGTAVGGTVGALHGAYQ